MSDNTEVDGPEVPTSIFQSNLSLEAKLDRARTELLDLSARNRLLNIPKSGKSAKIIEIIDEQAQHIFPLLVRDAKAFTFLPGRAASDAEKPDDDVIEDLAQPDNDSVDERGIAVRHTDTKLQTRLTPAGLQKRLLDMYYDARTLEEEQGVNILFLALGTLKWVDPSNPENVRFAPLILVPVSLERGNAAEKFKLKWRQEDLASNLSLEAYLDKIHSLKIPAFDMGEEFDPTAYFAAIREAVSSKPGWAVIDDDIVLGFFSFAKFLMYRDLDPENWPTKAKLSDHEIIKSLVVDGFESTPSLIGEDDPIDPLISPSQLTHIVDSDSSQALAVHEVRSGRNLVIQGPPGTGKSQTIANIIACAIADGKTVLFVAEKMAALEVVKRRLDNTGVGDACLELHSNKTNKRAVLEELRRTWELGAPKPENIGSLNARLGDTRQSLNEHAARLHQPLGMAGFTPYEVVGHLTRLRQKGQGPTDVTLTNPESWTSDELAERSTLITELSERVREMGTPDRHIWRGVGLTVALPPDVDRLVLRVTALSDQLGGMVGHHATLAQALEQSPPVSLADIDALQSLSSRLAEAPDLEAAALGAAAWRNRTDEITALLSAGSLYRSLTEELSPTFHEAAWKADTASIICTLEPLVPSLALTSFEYAGNLVDLIPTVLTEAGQLSTILGRVGAPTSLREIDDLILVADRVAAAPAADVNAFASDLWDSGVERAADLANAVEALAKARADIGVGLTEAAWAADLGEARRALASHGGGWFRFFSSEWRGANRIVRSFLTATKTPLDQQLAFLDALARGQAALAAIKDEADFGRSAFAADWRGDRSTAEPLHALVEWMRSLRGLGSEPRIIASRRPDRNRIGAASTRLSQLVQDVRRLFEALWQDLSVSRPVVFGSATDVAQADLSASLPALIAIRETHRTLEKICRHLDPDLASRLKSVRDLAAGQAALAIITQCGELGRLAYGSAWSSGESNWRLLHAAADWIVANLDIHELASRVQNRTKLPDEFEKVRETRRVFLAELTSLLESLKADESCVISVGALLDEPTTQLEAVLASWRDHGELLSKWVDYKSRATKASRLGMDEIVQRLYDGRLTPEATLTCFEMSYFERIFATQAQENPELAHFDGDLHGRMVTSFVDLDTQRIKHAAFEVVSAHFNRIPPAAGGAIGPLGILKSEIARKRGHMPIRQLVQKTAQAVQALKPVFMMSPLSVAQFLSPGAMTFDLLVMDEASQIQPVDALGAIARAKQVVVVGDPQQLPPTAFFTKMTSGGDGKNDDDDGAKVGDIESILGLFSARGLPMRMLRWHYRSRHQSLIAVSNRQFYENKLFIVPSPYTAQAGLGLRFHHVADGIFETGATRTNPIEAKVVAKAIIAHAIENPSQTLGVVAFSVAQRRAIQDQLELLRRSLDSKHEAFFQAHHAEPFFIKNLENVQGDERDVIFISVGYGPTVPGLKPPMRFGPVGIDGGERRLNVLISRAKRRCDVFSSMTDEDIDLDFASTRKGVFALKMFMHFARTGRMTMADHVGHDHVDVFEEQVAEALHARGYQVNRRVGVAGIFVDLAVVDPDHPGRFVLGIDCDGEAYSSARSARDRDRLRKSVLEDHGWHIHRIWSIDWFRRPKEQLERLESAIAAAKSELSADARRPAAAKLEIVTVERGDTTEMGLVVSESDSPSSVPYIEAKLTKPGLYDELHEAPTGLLALLAEKVVAIEGPVCFEEIVVRIREAWGLKRAGARIQEAVQRALDVGVANRRLEEEGSFYSIPGALPVVRDRGEAESATLRKPEALPPAELKVAIVKLVSSNFGATEDQIVLATGRAIGFRATSSQLRALIESAIGELTISGVLTRKDSLIDLGPQAPPRGARPVVPLPIERLLAEGEHEKLEFKQTLRWDTRQQAINRNLEEVAIKTLAAFANHSGGTLLIGVADDGAVTGLDSDFACLGGNKDKMELHLTNLLNSHFTQVFRASKVKVSFPLLKDRLICRVDVEKSRTPVFVNIGDRNGNIAERLFVRLGNSSHEIPASQIAAFVNERFDSA